MSNFVELAATLQQQQLDAVRQSQAAFLKFLESVPQQMPQAPELEVPEQVKEAMKPAYDFFGSPEEVQHFLNEVAKTWTQIGQDFQNQVLEYLSRKP